MELGIDEAVVPTGGEEVNVPPRAERFRAAREGIAFGPPLQRGLLRVSGSRRLEFLHRMSSQDLAKAAPTSTHHAAFLDAKAHVLAEGMVVVRKDDVLLDVEAGAAEALLEHLRRFVLREDVKIDAVADDLRVAPILGAKGGELACRNAALVPAWANPRRGVPAWDVVVPEAGWDWLRHALLEEGALELSENDLDGLRILAGVPRWGVDVDARRLVMEAGLVPTAVSFEKGCYLGQETVLRGTFRGQIQRGLVQLEVPAAALPGAKLRAGDKDVGEVTSAADTPEGRLALGYLRRAHWREGERLATEGGDAVVRRVLVAEKD